MHEISNGLVEAFNLIFSFDKEIYEIVGLSLFVSTISVMISTFIGIPLGVLLGTHTFLGK